MVEQMVWGQLTLEFKLELSDHFFQVFADDLVTTTAQAIGEELGDVLGEVGVLGGLLW